MMEENGRLPAYSVVAEEVQDCGGGWRFHLFLADVHEMVDAYSVRETDATGWFTRAEMSGLPPHSGIQRWLDEPPSGWVAHERLRGPSARGGARRSYLPVNE